MWPKTQRGWIQLTFAVILIVLLAFTAADQSRASALTFVPILGAAAVLFGTTDSGWRGSFSESIRRSRLRLSPARLYAGIFAGTLTGLVVLRLVIWLVGA